jgi:aminopeptidase N
MLGVLTTQAQSLINQKKQYTRADTLRGSLRPERTCYDVTYYELDVKIDTGKRSVTGSNRMVYKAVEDFTTLQLDLFDNMKVIAITAAGKELRYRREYNAIFVEMPETVKAGTTGELLVNYYGVPTVAKRAPWDGGFSWSYDRNGHTWIGVSCEGMGASSWWPCKDWLGDEPDSMRIHCNVPGGLRCVSNGREEPAQEKEDGTTTYNWLVSYPINSYNVTLNIGDYVEFSDEYIADDNTKLPLNYYVMRYNLDKARLHFMQVKPMMQCYEKYLGKYPFWNDGYALVETPYLGMEHQGAIAYGNKYLTGYAGTDYSRIGLDFDYIIIHETGHEWWGNSVSCSDIADMWIHESFCTYTESIYVECLFGTDTAIKYINAHKAHIDNKEPIVGPYGVNEEGDGDMYSKGALFLNTVRSIVNNDTRWWALIKGMADTTFKMKNIGYADVLTYFNNRTGTDLTTVFEQYLKHSAIPVLKYKLKKKKKGQYELTYQWATDVPDFTMPLIVSTTGNDKKILPATTTSQTVLLSLKKESDFKVRTDLLYIDTSQN